MVSAIDLGASCLGSSSDWGHCVVFWGKTLYSHSASSTQVYKWVLANLMLWVTLWWTSIPSRGGVEELLVASCYRNWDKLRPGGSQLVVCRLHTYHVDKLNVLPRKSVYLKCLHFARVQFKTTAVFNNKLNGVWVWRINVSISSDSIW